VGNSKVPLPIAASAPLHLASAPATAANVAAGSTDHHLGGEEMVMTHTASPTFDIPYSLGDRVARLDVLAAVLDTAFIIPGTNIRFGLDALIGLLPGIGDAITTAISLFIVHEAHRLGAPKHVIVRMLGNVALDGLIGAVPCSGTRST